MENKIFEIYSKMIEYELVDDKSIIIRELNKFMSYFFKNLSKMDSVERNGLAALVFFKIASEYKAAEPAARVSYYYLVKDVNSSWYGEDIATESIAKRLELILKGGIKMLEDHTHSNQEIDMAILADWLRIKNDTKDFRSEKWWIMANEDASKIRNNYINLSDTEIINKGENIHKYVADQERQYLERLFGTN